MAVKLSKAQEKALRDAVAGGGISRHETSGQWWTDGMKGEYLKNATCQKLIENGLIARNQSQSKTCWLEDYQVTPAGRQAIGLR